MENDVLIRLFRQRTGWPAGPWDTEPDRVDWLDPIGARPCLALRNRLGAWCGYVGVEPEHSWYGQNPRSGRLAVANVIAHGRLTYAGSGALGPTDDLSLISHVAEPGESEDVWWLGFDCAHDTDIIPVFLAQGIVMPHTKYRTLDYVMYVCEALAAAVEESVFM